MEHMHTEGQSEVTFHHAPQADADFYKKVRNTTILLSIITIIELAIGLTIYTIHKGTDPNATLVLMFKGMVCILSFAKAYYIVSVFMHLGDEIRNMIMTIVVPLMLFVWFIAAFMWDGHSYKTLRNKHDSHFKETTTKQHVPHQEAPAPAAH